MSKEAKIVIDQIKANNLPNSVTTVKVDNENVFLSCFQKIVAGLAEEDLTDTVVMIVAAIPITKKQKANILCIATYIPEKHLKTIPELLEDCIKDSIKDGIVNINDAGEPGSKVRTITYPAESEVYAHKEADVVKSTAWQILRKAEIEPAIESSSEEDYGSFEL